MPKGVLANFGVTTFWSYTMGNHKAQVKLCVYKLKTLSTLNKQTTRFWGCQPEKFLVSKRTTAARQRPWPRPPVMMEASKLTLKQSSWLVTSLLLDIKYSTSYIIKNTIKLQPTKVGIQFHEYSVGTNESNYICNLIDLLSNWIEGVLEFETLWYQ